MFWDLLAYPWRKARCRKALERYINSVILGDDTYIVCIEQHHGSSIKAVIDYFNIRAMLYAICEKLYSDRGLNKEFYGTGMSLRIGLRLAQIKIYGAATWVGNYMAQTYCFTRTVPAKRILFIVSSQIGKDSVSTERYMEITDLIFDLIQKKGDPKVSPLTYSDGSQFATLVELKKAD